jgi:hypothetical protein
VVAGIAKPSVGRENYSPGKLAIATNSTYPDTAIRRAVVQRRRRQPRAAGRSIGRDDDPPAFAGLIICGAFCDGVSAIRDDHLMISEASKACCRKTLCVV